MKSFLVLILIIIGVNAQMNCSFKQQMIIVNTTFRCLKIMDWANTTLYHSIIYSSIYIKYQGSLMLSTSQINGRIDIGNTAVHINGTSILQSNPNIYQSQIILYPNSVLKSYESDLERVNVTLIQPNANIDIGLIRMKEVTFTVDVSGVKVLPNNLTLVKCVDCKFNQISLTMIPEFVKAKLIIVTSSTNYSHSANGIFVDLTC